MGLQKTKGRTHTVSWPKMMTLKCRYSRAARYNLQCTAEEAFSSCRMLLNIIVDTITLKFSGNSACYLGTYRNFQCLKLCEIEKQCHCSG